MSYKNSQRASVPVHFQEDAKKGLDRNMRLGVLGNVPVNNPVMCCTWMLFQPKRSGKVLNDSVLVVRHQGLDNLFEVSKEKIVNAASNVFCGFRP